MNNYKKYLKYKKNIYKRKIYVVWILDMNGIMRSYYSQQPQQSYYPQQPYYSQQSQQSYYSQQPQQPYYFQQPQQPQSTVIQELSKGLEIVEPPKNVKKSASDPKE